MMEVFLDVKLAGEVNSSDLITRDSNETVEEVLVKLAEEGKKVLGFEWHPESKTLKIII